jgi:hypothetical protein
MRTEGDDLPPGFLAGLFMADAGRWDSRELHATNQQLSAQECVSVFRVMKIKDQIDHLRAALAKAEEEGDSEKVAELISQQLALTRQRNSMMHIEGSLKSADEWVH